ncbi:probable bifunctional dTTP/UTP pyrophosphatase/methyltransferase protein [Ursus arctos]|uniref:probable bifunctional dTTP/UTP pyrophosphatase/methyltransferase protein n=1 Tax=Ursus arctos TaxID=9644 RepID=UPI00254864EF|nr:probable bifunctional dTTP/UTP pyrophosphatase/methyltransferase protein [Ursus arctos]
MVLSPVIGKLLHKRVVLASASPRRREILSHAGLRFEVVPSRFKEKLDKASFPTPYAYAIETAKQKALEVASRMHQKDLRAPDIVIGADTIVTVGGLILEKPVDKQDAYRMLSRLNGKEHSVFTGVAIVHCCTKDGQLDMEVSEFHEETAVKFSELSEELLWEYIDSGEPMDKAGGYGIQALGGMLVEYVRGDFLNVVGFPLNHFCKKLVELYYPPRREDVQRVKHDSIPPVDTFENLSDVEGGSSDPAQGNDGGGHGRTEGAGDTGQASADRRGPDSNGTVETPPPFPVGLLELIDGFKASKALFTACKLKVFDVLKDEAPLKAVDVAGKIDASVCGTERLLDVCAALGLLEKTDRGYRNTELADLHLASDGEYSLHGLAMHNNDHFWNLFADLELAVREGADAAFGRKTADPVQSKPAKLQFMRAMHGLAKLTAHQVATAFDLSRFTLACDLGGCTGALARALTREYPRLKVTVFDLPEVIEHVTCFQPEGRQTERISYVPGDFFKDGLPEADLYILSRILHDWPDHKVRELLSRVSSSCKPGGGILVAEMVLEEKPAARGSLPASLNLLVRTQGRERSLPEYRRLLEQHGFCDVQLAHVGDGLDVILGTRASPA